LRDGASPSRNPGRISSGKAARGSFRIDVARVGRTQIRGSSHGLGNVPAPVGGSTPGRSPASAPPARTFRPPVRLRRLRSPAPCLDTPVTGATKIRRGARILGCYEKPALGWGHPAARRRAPGPGARSGLVPRTRGRSVLRDYLLPGPPRGRRAVRLPPVRLKERGKVPKRTGVQAPTLQPLSRPSLPLLAQYPQQEGEAPRVGGGEGDMGGGAGRQLLHRLLLPDLVQHPQQDGDAARVGEGDVGGGIARQQLPHRLVLPGLV